MIWLSNPNNFTTEQAVTGIFLGKRTRLFKQDIVFVKIYKYSSTFLNNWSILGPPDPTYAPEQAATGAFVVWKTTCLFFGKACFGPRLTTFFIFCQYLITLVSICQLLPLSSMAGVMTLGSKCKYIYIYVYVCVCIY